MTDQTWQPAPAVRGTQRLLAVRELAPPADVAATLGLAAGEHAVVRRRVTYQGDRPVELTDSYYPATVARDTALAEPRALPGDTASLLATLGYPVHEHVEDVSAGLPAPEARGALHLPAGDPVLLLTRTSLTATLLPVEVSQTIIPSGRHLRYRTSANGSDRNP
ncbi:UTRA domain-containing protein [Streptomyces sp. B6B3]|uniref:UTRA domain-containing protein n=1 Tax=Streptomyces sp. B6B3 TaxID=3153570 RepID=UPI00325F033F